MLQDDWWIAVFRPNSVSIGCTDRQFDFLPQSPHPSHTRSLMKTRVIGSIILPRLRSRRFSAAQCWSWISTVTPLMAASRDCASSSRSRCQTSALPAIETPEYLAGSSLVMMIRLTPSASRRRLSAGIGRAPAAFWPPVIATAPL